MRYFSIAIISILLQSGIAFSQLDYSKTKTLHMVSNAHFDTQWRWTVQSSIDDYLLNTLNQNFYLIEKYPYYNFNFEGAIRYMWAKEYYPAKYDSLKRYIAARRWNICGSSLEAGDVNIPSPEAIIRNILIGQTFYRNEFGTVSRDIFLPDCFGFGYALPSIAAHCGLKGFSTQKLTWGSAVGIPFDIGHWQGVDGSSLLAVLNAQDYTYKIKEDMSANTSMIAAIDSFGIKTGQYVGYKYYGVGDRGGAPTEESVQWLGKSIEGNGSLKVLAAPADLLCRELSKSKTTKFPVYNGELLATFHGTGCYTAHAAMKRWNRKNEQLADAAERVAIMADWFGGVRYPQQILNDAWTRFLWHQFHDDLTGTSIAEAYDFSWNDQIIAMTRFNDVLEDAAGTVARALHTKGTGIPVVIYNPLSFEQEKVLEVTINSETNHIKVLDPNFNEVPSQFIRSFNGKTTLLLSAKAPSVGFAVYDVQTLSTSPSTLKNTLKITKESIENNRYKVLVDMHGDVSSIYDKLLKKELLSAPIRFVMLNDSSTVYPAWEIHYKTVSAPARSYVDENVRVEVLEQGPVRASLKITRSKEGSEFIQFIRLGYNAQSVEFENEVKWSTKGTLLKVEFPLTANNYKATYDLGLGTIARGNNTDKLFEVPAQQWADITDKSGLYGVSILNDCKYGWDKPTDNMLRLTLLHTPATKESYQDQESLDLGRHRFTFAVCGHKGDWRTNTIEQAASLNQSLMAFETKPSYGELGRSLSFVKMNSKQVIIKAIKKAESSKEIIIRLQEIHGRNAANVRVAFPMRILTLREVNGAEEHIANIPLKDSILITSFKPYQTRTFALTLAPSLETISVSSSIDLGLDYNMDVVSNDSDKFDGNIIDGKTIPAELFPTVIDHRGIKFVMGTKENGRMNAMSCRGGKITLPKIQYRSFYFLAASRKSDIATSFVIDGKTYPIYVQSMFENIGQWDKTKVFQNEVNGVQNNFSYLENAFIKREKIAWYATHLHNKYTNSNESYKFAYLFCYKIDLPENAHELILPNNEDIIIFAISMGKNYNETVKPAHDIIDRADVQIPIRYSTSTNSNAFEDKIELAMYTIQQSIDIHYTLDGSEPNEKSPLYQNPLIIDQSAILKAKTYIQGYETGYEICVPLYKGKFNPAIQYNQVVQGLDIHIFEGSWDNIPSFDTMKATLYGTAPCIAIPNDYLNKDNFAIQYKGYIRVPEDGMYVFTLSSDDGSKLWVDNKQIIDIDGIHGTIEKTSGQMLRKGLHALRIDYFEAIGGEEINLFIEGPGMKKQMIPASMLFRKK